MQLHVCETCFNGSAMCNCSFHIALREAKERLQTWIDEGKEIQIQCRVVIKGEHEENVRMCVKQRLSVEAVTRMIVTQEQLRSHLSNHRFVETRPDSVMVERSELAGQLVTAEDVTLSLGDKHLESNQTLEDAGVESDAALTVVIDGALGEKVGAQEAAKERRELAYSAWRRTNAG